MAGMLTTNMAYSIDKACHIRVKTTLMGQPLSMDRCLEYQMDVSKADMDEFFKACHQMANVGVAFGGAAGTATQLEACSRTNVSAICTGINKKPINEVVYAESVEDIRQEGERCNFSGGKWQVLNLGK